MVRIRMLYKQYTERRKCKSKWVYKTISTMSLYICVISDPQEFIFLCPIERNLRMRYQCEPITNAILVDVMKVLREDLQLIREVILYLEMR